MRLQTIEKKYIKGIEENRSLFDQQVELFKSISKGARVTQSVRCLTSAHVTISQFVGSSTTLGSVLTARSLETASDSVSLSLLPSHAHALSLSLKNK